MVLVILFLAGLSLSVDYIVNPSQSFWTKLGSWWKPHEEKAAKIDRALKTKLREAGLQTGDLQKEKIIPQREGAKTWNYIQREYNLPADIPLETVRRKVKEAATEAGGEILSDYQERMGKTRILGMVLGVDHQATHLLQFTKGPGTKIASLPQDRQPRPPVSPSGSYKIAIIIDDLGANRILAHSFMALGKPLTLSFFPHQTYTKELSQEAKDLGYEVMLHLPMEPQGYPDVDPGEGALLKSMSKEELKQALNKDLAEVPLAAGVNNHMGSRLTEDQEAMRVVLAELKRRGLFFVDSKTSGKSVAAKVAEELELPSATRQIFLDNEEKEDYIRQQLELLAKTAKKKGSAIGIAHPHPATIRVLEEELPQLEKQGFQIVRVSELLSKPAMAKIKK